MTSDDPPTARQPERDVEEDTRRYSHNNASQSVAGVRQGSLRRVIVLDVVVGYDYRTNGAAHQRWIDRKKENIHDSLMNFVSGLRPGDFDALAESAAELFDAHSVEFLTDVSERTAWDYLKTLRHFHLH